MNNLSEKLAFVWDVANGSRLTADGYGSTRASATLGPDSIAPSFIPIVLVKLEEGEMAIFAELVEVLA
ncbi:MAG: hypothetical protein AB7S38_40230 [Vulcanimicrobiota bacterium]